MDGVINIYKKKGITSFDVVKKVRNLSGIKKVGHTGTLDPEASGVLPVCVGHGTKIVDFIMNGKKIYLAELKLGVITDTYDIEGSVIKQSEVKLSEENIKDTILSFIGEIQQIPPMYSALKINGKKLYELARAGIEVPRESRNVTIYNIEIVKINIPFVKFKVECSKGTYIRSLCFDIGEKLKCGGTMWSLERLQTGTFNINESIHIDELTSENIENYIIPIDKALQNFQQLNLDTRYEKLLLNGVNIRNPQLLENIPSAKTYRVYINNKFIGLGIKTTTYFKMLKLLI